ncbi:MAG TPA: EAL domain-containing protein [Acidimicrobiia bacterium]|nr:EAL domain-containing protein [Acidimicrobiia bacterium]
MDQGFPWARLAAVAGGIVAALVLHGLAGLGPIPAAGLPATAIMVAALAVHRRPRPADVPPGWTDPCRLLVAGTGVLALTSAGVGSGLAPVGLIAYPLLIIGLLRLQSARLPDREADVLVQAGLLATTFAIGLWVLSTPARLRLDIPLGTAEVSVALAALDLLLLTMAVHLLLLPGERLFVYRGTALALAFLFGAHLVSALALFNGESGTGGVVSALVVVAFGLLAVSAFDPSARRLFEPLIGEPARFSAAHLVLIEMGMIAPPAVIAFHAVRQVAVPPAPAIGVGVASVVLAAYLGNLVLQRSVIERRAEHDGLTGLPNRMLFFDRLSRALAHARRNDLPVAVMFVDLDRFKEVNDSLGHAAGDSLLCHAAARMRACVRDEDTVARLGGDEFGLLLPHVSGIDGAVAVARRVLAAFAEPVELAGQPVVVSPSIGISLFPQDGADAEAIVEGADAAMYRAKERGRNTFEIFSPALRSEALERLALEVALRRALEVGELVLHYQPKVDLKTGRITGAEALVRWNHPERGLLMPGAFVPLAEQTGLVVALGEFVIAAACEQLAAWRAAGMPELTVAVNVSACQLRQGLADYVTRALRLACIPGRALELELTESALLESLEVTVEQIQELRAHGVTCSIDDFGTGYCGLSYLNRLPIDALKIDRSFITELSGGSDTIVTAVISLGHSLGLKVIAEGVETADQLAYLASRGCDEMQGFLFSRPVPADEFAALVRSASGLEMLEQPRPEEGAGEAPLPALPADELLFPQSPQGGGDGVGVGDVDGVEKGLGVDLLPR